MANGNGADPIRVRMWRAAKEDVSARGNPLDEVRFAAGFIAAEIDKRDAIVADLRAEVASLRGTVERICSRLGEK